MESGSKENHGHRKRHAPPSKYQKIVEWSRIVIENNYVVGFTTVLTIWALTGSDLRMMFTTKAFDAIFNWIVGVMLVTFTFELILSSIGKDDYFLGFFFWLDLISTLTLVLDLTFVAEIMMGTGGSEDGSEGSELRGGKTAKIGAKAGRVVRVLRLVRILKLYKAYYDAQIRKKRREERLKNGLQEQDAFGEWDDEDLDEDTKPQKINESRVGKKLSEMTTRRVICLILAMLLLLPFLAVDSVSSNSADYGADFIMDIYKHYQNGTVDRSEYEQALLQYVYYHNWYAGQTNFCSDKGLTCADEYYGHVFWVGLMGTNKNAVLENIDKTKLSAKSVTDFNTEASVQNHIYNYGTMPVQAQEILSNTWTTNCDSATRTRRGISIISRVINDVNSEPILCPDELRSEEKALYYPLTRADDEHTEWTFVFYFDMREFTRASAMYSVLTTLFVMVLLVSATLMFSADANKLVVNPVEKMINVVEQIGANPLIAMKMADEEFKIEEIKKAQLAREHKQKVTMMMKRIMACQCVKDPKGSEPMETVVLEKTIIKLGSLLALGFGEAGANIIGHNMSGSDSAGVNAMVPGSRVNCIIGVARVRDFSTATEVLQAKIMTFVNQIAEIVHGVVNEFHGAPNKNNGDSFLIIWRLENTKGAATASMQQFAEMSVSSFATILGQLHRSQLLATYRGHPGLQMRLGTECRVNLSFGLHLGWAIEGAVGSEFKIDASYLSPNVSIATSVERATAVYGVSLIVAQSVHEQCSHPMAKEHRLIDRVIITGSTEPMGLYSLDLDWMSVQVSQEGPLSMVWSSHNRFKARQNIESAKTLKVGDGFVASALFREDPDILAMRRRFTTEFFEVFNMGYQNYALGEWKVARKMLSRIPRILGMEDGPSSAILRFMELSYGFEAPKGWKGIRDVDTKQIGSG